MKAVNRHTSRRGRAGIMFLVVFLGFAVGVALFTPWEKLCERLVQHVDSKLINLNFTWKDIRRAGPSGFRIDDLVIGFENSPGALRFEHADLRFGISPLAKVRLNTGGDECHLNIFRNGHLELDGKVDLTYLFGGGRLQGSVFAKGGFMPSPKGELLGSGWLDLRAHRLVLPDGTLSEDLSLTLEIQDKEWNIKNASIRKPIDFQGSGLFEPDRTNFTDSVVKLNGEVAVGDEFHPVELESRLGLLLGASGS